MRVRFRFAKVGKVRFTSHRDVARMFERAFRRAEIPLAYTEGFSPRPRMHFGLALSTGHESVGEYLDVDLVAETDLDLLPALLSPVLPVGIDVQIVVALAPQAVSLQADVTACTWLLAATGLSYDESAYAVTTALAAPTLDTTRTRKGIESVDDIRPAIRTLELIDDFAHLGAGSVVLRAELATQPRGLRPAELLGAVLPGAEEARVVRTHQWIERDGARREPIPYEATSLLHTLAVCA